MNIWDSKKTRKIVEILQQNKQGIGFRKLSRDSGISRGGLEVCLKRLRELSIVKDEPRLPILLTEEALEKCKKNTLVIPRDPRSKKNKLTDRERKTLLLILSISAFGRVKMKRIYQTQSRSRFIVKSLKDKEFLYGDGRRLSGIAINDIIPKYPRNNKSKTRSSLSNHNRSRLLENQVNPFNMGLFGYLELSIDEVKKSMKFLTQYESPILVEKKYHNQTRYVIKDEQLKEFIKVCVILFSQDVYSILECLYSLNESRLRDRKKKEIEHFERFPSSYPNTSKEERISQINQYIKSFEKSSFYDYRLKRNPTFDNKGQQPDQINTFQDWMREIWFGKDKASIHFNFIKRGLLPDIDHELKRAITDIHKCNIFDAKA